MCAHPRRCNDQPKSKTAPAAAQRVEDWLAFPPLSGRMRTGVGVREAWAVSGFDGAAVGGTGVDVGEGIGVMGTMVDVGDGTRVGAGPGVVGAAVGVIPSTALTLVTGRLNKNIKKSTATIAS